MDSTGYLMFKEFIIEQKQQKNETILAPNDVTSSSSVSVRLQVEV